MLRHSFMWAFICATAPLAFSKTADSSFTESCDTAEYTISPQVLDEIVVKAAPVISKNDRKVIRPDKETLRLSADGIDLLRRLHLPRISVNPLTNAVAVSGGGDVIFCINGVESTQAQVAALLPQDISRIEYHDNPGVRYAGASAVIDCITTRNDAGGNVSFDTFSALAKGRWATIDHLSGQYNSGRSVWSVNAGYMGQHKDSWLRSYDEEWHYPDATLSRHEEGLPVAAGQSGLESNINYNYLHPAGDMLNVRIGFSLYDVPEKEEGDRLALLQTSVSETPVLVREHTEEHSATPDIGLYYMHPLTENGNLIFELQGSYMRSDVKHEYSEGDTGESNRVRGDKYAMKFLGMYENRRGSRVWSAGVAGSGSAIANTYFLPDAAKVRIGRFETAVFGEYSDRFGNWTPRAGVRVAYRHLVHSSGSIDKVFVLPSASIAFRPSPAWMLRYTASLDYSMPGAAEISNMEQTIQPGMIRKGNPALQPFRVIEQSLDISFESKYVSVEPRLEYRNEHNPVMESVVFEDGRFVRTYFNERSFQRLTAGAAVTVRPWKNHLSLTAEPRLTRYFSHGTAYSHCHTIFRTGVSIDFSYGNWLAYAGIMSGPANNMYGEEIIEEKDMNQIMAGYRHANWSVHAGVFNAFLKNYWMETRNLSAIAPFTSKARSGRGSSYFAIKFNINLDFGKGRRDVELRDNDIDNDSGILSGTK